MKTKNHLSKQRTSAIYKSIVALIPNIKGIYYSILHKEHSPATIRLFLFEVAQQCNSSEPSKHTMKLTVGEDIVKYALECFPHVTLDDTLE